MQGAMAGASRLLPHRICGIEARRFAGKHLRGLFLIAALTG